MKMNNANIKYKKSNMIKLVNVKSVFFIILFSGTLVIKGSSQNTFPGIGNVGIGITTPFSLFHLKAKGAGWDDQLILESNAGGKWQFLVDGGSANRLRIRNRDTGIEALTFQTNGYVGIGTPTPSGLLHLNSANPDLYLTSTSSTPSAAIRGNYGTWILGYGGQPGYEDISIGTLAGEQRTLTLAAGGSARMKIIANGNVGIGTTTPSSQVHIQSNNSAQNGLRIQNTTSSKSVYIENYGSTGSGTYWPNFQSANTACLLYEGQFVLRSTDGLIFSGSNTTEHMRITQTGKVGINTPSPDVNYELSVNGKIKTKEIKVTQLNWSDYVFYDNYKLRPLTEVESFIKNNQHLPEVPSAAEVEKDGINVGEMNALLLKKIEEVTLYLIEQKKEIEGLKEENKSLRKLIEQK